MVEAPEIEPRAFDRSELSRSGNPEPRLPEEVLPPDDDALPDAALVAASQDALLDSEAFARALARVGCMPVSITGSFVCGESTADRSIPFRPRVVGPTYAIAIREGPSGIELMRIDIGDTLAGWRATFECTNCASHGFLVDRGRVYVSTIERADVATAREKIELHAFDLASGERRWARHLPASFAYVTEPSLLIVNLHGQHGLATLDGLTGRTVSSSDPGMIRLSTRSQGRCAVVASASVVERIDLATGRVLFRVPHGLSPSLFQASAEPAAGRVVLLGQAPEGGLLFRVVSARDGSELSRVLFPDSAGNGSIWRTRWRWPWLLAWPEDSGDAVFAVDATTGRTWRSPPDASRPSRVAAGNEAVYVLDDVGCVDALDRRTGARRWWSCIGEPGDVHLLPVRLGPDEPEELVIARRASMSLLSPRNARNGSPPPVTITGRIVGPWTPGDILRVGRETVRVGRDRRFRVVVRTRGVVEFRFGPDAEMGYLGSNCEALRPFRVDVAGRSRLSVTLHTESDAWCESGFAGA